MKSSSCELGSRTLRAELLQYFLKRVVHAGTYLLKPALRSSARYPPPGVGRASFSDTTLTRTIVRIIINLVTRWAKNIIRNNLSVKRNHVRQARSCAGSLPGSN